MLTGATAWAAASTGVWLRYLDFRRREILEAIRREERLELARELHDDVAHHVTGIVVQAQAARFAGEQDPELLISALGSIESAGVNTLAAVRQVVGLLRDLDDTRGVSPTPEPISQLVERFAKHGPPVDLRIPADLTASGWPPQLASTVYRIVQEALTNVARHAPDARSVAVTFTHDPQQVRVEITDDAPSAASHRSAPAAATGSPGCGSASRLSAATSAPGRCRAPAGQSRPACPSPRKADLDPSAPAGRRPGHGPQRLPADPPNPGDRSRVVVSQAYDGSASP